MGVVYVQVGQLQQCEHPCRAQVCRWVFPLKPHVHPMWSVPRHSSPGLKIIPEQGLQHLQVHRVCVIKLHFGEGKQLQRVAANPWRGFRRRPEARADATTPWLYPVHCRAHRLVVRARVNRHEIFDRPIVSGLPLLSPRRGTNGFLLRLLAPRPRHHIPQVLGVQLLHRWMRPAHSPGRVCGRVLLRLLEVLLATKRAFRYRVIFR